MSFFDTEEVLAVMLDIVADRGPVDHRSSGPGSSVKSTPQSTCPVRCKKRLPYPSLLPGQLEYQHYGAKLRQ